jgi:hypothetical protein
MDVDIVGVIGTEEWDKLELLSRVTIADEYGFLNEVKL